MVTCDQVVAVPTWAGVATGFGHTCATRTDGTLWCWGDSSSGQLGLGAVAYTTTPAQVLAEPTRTPWNSLNSRLRAPAALQLTLFTELGDQA